MTKGSGVTGALRYALGQGNDPDTGKRIELAPGETGRAELIGGQNFGFAIETAHRLEVARRILEWQGEPENQASRTRLCVKDCLHLSLSWGIGQTPDKQEMAEAAQGALKSLGMETARAVFIAHSDTEHAHMHIIASRIDPATGKAFPDRGDQIAVQAWALKWERQRGQIVEARRELHRLVDAAIARDAGALLSALTARKPTFSLRELDMALAYAELDLEARRNFRAELLKHPEIVPLRVNEQARVSRYTTRATLVAERNIIADARSLATRGGYRLRQTSIDRARLAHGLSAEQAAALERAAADNAFAIIGGPAGTGKSRALAAIRDAHLLQGRDVIGMASTNAVVHDMRRSGFASATTIAAEMTRIEHHRARWGPNTVLVIDEAAMLSTKTLADVIAGARVAGAKVILAGDERQLSSVDRGGLFAPLKAEFGAAELREIHRTRDPLQRDAFRAMHERDFRAALGAFETRGDIHWAATRQAAVRALGDRYARDVQADPAKSRFIFAYTNEQAKLLNDYARGVAARAGRLGPEQTLPTADGPAPFAAGDRIQFTGNGRTPRGKSLGLVNGAAGTVVAIENRDGAPQLTVALDGRRGRTLTFPVGDKREIGEFNQFRHGYAGTIYKAQGRTLDQTYVFHSSHWRAASAYVALTRHRESVAIFAARDTAANLDALADQMSRGESTQAASVYTLSPDDARAIAAEIARLAQRQEIAPAAALEPHRPQAPQASSSTGFTPPAAHPASRTPEGPGRAPPEAGGPPKAPSRPAIQPKPPEPAQEPQAQPQGLTAYQKAAAAVEAALEPPPGPARPGQAPQAPARDRGDERDPGVEC